MLFRDKAWNQRVQKEKCCTKEIRNLKRDKGISGVVNIPRSEGLET